MRRIVRVAAIAAVGSIALLPATADAGGGGTPCPKGTREGAVVEVRDSCFTPRALTVPAGAAVTWRLDNAYAAHNVTSDDGLFASEDLGELFSVRFNTPGTYRYVCTYHGGSWGGMVGTVVVEGNAVGGTDPVTVLSGEAPDDPETLVAEAEHRLATAITAVLREAQAERSEPAAAGAAASGVPLVAVWAGAAGVSAIVAWFVRGRRDPA